MTYFDKNAPAILAGLLAVAESLNPGPGSVDVDRIKPIHKRISMSYKDWKHRKRKVSHFKTFTQNEQGMKTFLLLSCLTCLAIVGYALAKERKPDPEWEPMNSKEDNSHNPFVN